MDLRRLRYFVAVAQTLHFTRAAEELHIAQPALSQQIKALEADLGVRLLERDNRNVALTDAGRVLLEEAIALLRAVDSARARTIAAAAGDSGTLRVNFVRSAPGWPSSAIIDAFRVRFPNVGLNLSSGFTAMHVEALCDDRLDIAFVHPPVLADGLELMLLVQEPFVAAMCTDHPLATRASVTLDELRREPIIWWPREHSPGMHDRLFNRIWGASSAAPIARLEPDEDQMLRAAAEGVGIALVLRSRAEMMRVAGTSVLGIEDASLTVDIALAWRAGNSNAKVTRFIEIAEGVVSPGRQGRGTRQP
jgi:DNA-binding transcriptional LysR family regulator